VCCLYCKGIKQLYTMTKIFTTILLSFTFFVSIGQTIYEPQILILSPNEVKYDKVFENEIAGYNDLIEKSNKLAEQEKGLKSSESVNQPANIKLMIQDEVTFYKNIDFFKQISSISEQFLAYKFFEKFPNLLIELKDAKSRGSIEDLKNISEQTKLQYVLNFRIR